MSPFPYTVMPGQSCFQCCFKYSRTCTIHPKLFSSSSHPWLSCQVQQTLIFLLFFVIYILPSYTIFNKVDPPFLVVRLFFYLSFHWYYSLLYFLLPHSSFLPMLPIGFAFPTSDFTCRLSRVNHCFYYSINQKLIFVNWKLKPSYTYKVIPIPTYASHITIPGQIFLAVDLYI